eukprot:SAG22_NODE_892_length_6646_cov_21.438369_6_plen_413_part_00
MVRGAVLLHALCAASTCAAEAACTAAPALVLTLPATEHAARAVDALQQHDTFRAWSRARAAVDAAAAACDSSGSGEPSSLACTPPESGAAADMARLLAVLATEHWAYWLAWPQSQQMLSRWIGSSATDGYLVAARRRWAQLWPDWAGTGRGGELERPSLLGPPAQRYRPFAPPEVLIWDLPDTAARRLRDRRLASAAAMLFESLGSTRNRSSGGRRSSGRLPNDAFFAAQNRWHSRTGRSVFGEEFVPADGWAADAGNGTRAGSNDGAHQLALSPASFAELEAIFRQAVREAPAAGCGSGQQSMLIWASVHGHDSPGHGEHDHPLSSCSGVFYAAAPAGSGALQFEDPRGTDGAPPFNKEFEVQPRAGRVVLWPGWLRHRVAISSQPRDRGPEHERWRVSFSFNLHGEWSLY